MTLSQGTRDLHAAGVWAAAADADKTDPTDAGIARTRGWDQRYEQIDSGSYPERAVDNARSWEQESGIMDVLRAGVPAWDSTLDYAVTAAVRPFVTTPSGLWVALRSSGPGHGGSVNPDATRQTAWRMY